MKKSTLLTIVALVLALAMGVTGTMAYLQDSDADVNVMTLGNVYIEQHEDQLAADGQTTEPYEQNKPFFPGCEISKIVSVENTGKSDAYFRTLFAFESVDSDTFEINFPINENYTWSWGAPEAKVEINGKTFEIYEALYKGVLAPGETSPVSLTKVEMGAAATNEDMEALGGNYEILVVSQAVQTAGFASAQEALDAAFGDINENNHPWLGVAPNDAPTSVIEVSTIEELEAAIASGDKVLIHLNDGVYTGNRFHIGSNKEISISGSSEAVLDVGFMVTGKLNLTGMTVKNDNAIEGENVSKFSKTAISLQGEGAVVCNNVTFEQSLSNGTAITSWWDTGVGTSITVKGCTFNSNGQRPIQANGNVTVENTKFNDPYRYTIQMTGKASTASKMDKAIINYHNNTIVNGEGGKAYVYGIQLEGSDYGCHYVVINGSGNTIVDGGLESTMYYCECGLADHNTITWNVEVDPVHATDSVSSDAEFAAAVAAGKTAIVLEPGVYENLSAPGKALVITGPKDAIIKVKNEGEDGCDYGFGSGGAGVGNITFNGVTIDTTSNTGNYKGFAYMKGTFNNCNFVGAYSLNNANDFQFNNCTFDFKNGYFWTWGAKSVSFDGCTFNGNSKAILAHGNASTVININDCTFAATEKGYTGAGDNTAVVEMDPVGSNTYTINFTGENTKTDVYAGWTRIKDGSTGHVVNGAN